MALPILLSRVDERPEHLEEALERYGIGIVGHLDPLGMARCALADLQGGGNRTSNTIMLEDPTRHNP